MSIENERVADFTPFKDWVIDCGGKTFQTHSAAEWFIRRHRARLVQSGQLIVRKGQAGSLVGPQFDSVVLAILRDESRLPAGGAAA
jgi:hypothetical protein